MPELALRQPSASQSNEQLAFDPSALRRMQKIGRAEWLVLFSIALCVLDGAIRKWVLRDDEGFLKYVPYFSKDVAFALLLFIPRPIALGDLGRVLWAFLKVGLSICVVGAAAGTVFNLES